MLAVGRGADTGLTLMSKAGFRRMRLSQQGTDCEACRDNAGNCPGEGRDPDGTTLRRVLMSQYRFLSCLVALVVNEPATPTGEEVIGISLDLHVSLTMSGDPLPIEESAAFRLQL